MSYEDDELRDELIAIVNAMSQIGEDGFLVDLCVERKRQILKRRRKRALVRGRSQPPALMGVLGAVCITTAVVLAICLVPAMSYDRENYLFLAPSSLSPVYYVALFVTVAVSVLGAGRAAAHTDAAKLEEVFSWGADPTFGRNALKR